MKKLLFILGIVAWSTSLVNAQVTTAPSAIQRQGTDVTSNDPRLNLPGTPENLI